MIKILIILITSIINTNAFLDYDSEFTLICSKINPNKSFQQSLNSLWDVSILHAIDRYMFLVISPVLVIVEIFFILVFIQYKGSLFKKQGTIFFSIVCIQTVLNSYEFIHALYVTLNPYEYLMPSSFPSFCITTGIINQLCKMGLTLYLLYFIIYTLLNMKSSIRKEQVIKAKFLHSSVFICCVGWIVYIYFEDRFGINLFGLCGDSNLRDNKIYWFDPVFNVSLTTIYLIIAFYTYFYFKKHMPVSDGLVKRIYHENQAISFFVIVETILIGLFDASMNIVYFNCFRQQPIPGLLFFSTIMNLSRLLQTSFLLYFIRTDRIVKKKMKKYLRSYFQNKKAKMTSFSSDQSNPNQFSDINEQLDIEIRQRIIELKQQEHEIDLFRVAQIMTMIACVNIAFRQYFGTPIFSQDIKKLHFKQRINFQISPNSLADYNIAIGSIPKAGVLKGTITLVAPRIFNKLLGSDGLKFVERSFDLAKNYHKMYNIAEGKGGKSGQFFFFSYDNKYVLKTITKLEFNFIFQNLQEFFDYYQKNPTSLLAKIYGLCTIKGQDIGATYDLILMKNIIGCKKRQVIRTYDLKGSKMNRQVMNKKNNYKLLQNITLKDTDFLNYEGKIHISSDNVEKIRNSLRRDTMFLKNLNLIDYSLLIIRVNWLSDPEQTSFWNQLQRIPSSLNEHQYYHIGLIDYMQAWNISKKSENWFKSFLNKRDQISSQQPNFYQRRFMEFVEEITHYPSGFIFPVIKQFDQSSISKTQSSKFEKTDEMKSIISDESRSNRNKSDLKLLELVKKIEQSSSDQSSSPFQVPSQLLQINKLASLNSSQLMDLLSSKSLSCECKQFIKLTQFNMNKQQNKLQQVYRQ